METVPSDITMRAASSVSEAIARIPLAPAYTPVEPSPAERDAPVRVRLGLQQRAAANLRRHMWRAVRRFAVLVVGDLGSYYIMRELMRGLRGIDVLAGPLSATLPRNIFNGWQYAAALLVALFVTGNYGRGDQRRDPRRLFLACALATALPLWMTIWTRGLEPVIMQYAITTVLVWAGLALERQAMDTFIERIQPRYRNAAATLFVGPAEQCREAIDSPGFAIGGECRPVGFVDVHVPPAADALGHVSDFRRLLDRTGAEVVVICGYLPDGRFREVVDSSLEAESQLLSVPRSIAIAGVQPTLAWRRGQPVIELTAPSLKGWQLAVKRVVDVIGSAIGLALASPVLLGIAIAVKLDSRGPVLFEQERVGFGGRVFRMLKFRTMKDGADREKRSVAHLNHTGDPRLFKIPNDPRVTALGRWLRRYSLDELPQLWNVLIGDMSLVGPRPFFESDLAGYEDHHFRRLGAKPGITGLWQVSGRSDIVEFEEVVRLDTQYIRDWSLPLDLEILARTVPAVLKRRGAL